MNPRVIGSVPSPSSSAPPASSTDTGPASATSRALPVFVPTMEVSVDSAAAPAGWNGAAVLPQQFGVALPPEQLREIESQVRSLSIRTMPLLQIAGLGADTEVALHKSLGAFLDRIDKGDSPQIFRLVSELSAAVKAEDLGGLADKILTGKPDFFEGLLAKLSPKRLAASRDAMFENLRMMVSGKTRKLGSVLDKMEKEIEVEKGKAIDEARTLERLKENYQDRFRDFALASVFLSTLVAKARGEFAAIQAAEAAGRNDSNLSVQEAQDKLQAIESRALAIEGVFTKLPAEQLVIRQVQTATIQTVQEVTTTTAARFASIKMTLLTLHGAMSVQNLQRVAQQGADLDQNLAAVRNRLVTSVVTSAANAPGDNRLAQAEQLREVVKNTEQLQIVVEKARVDNAAKFEQARAMLLQARQDLTALGAVIRPDKPLNL